MLRVKTNRRRFCETLIHNVLHSMKYTMYPPGLQFTMLLRLRDIDDTELTDSKAFIHSLSSQPATTV